MVSMIEEYLAPIETEVNKWQVVQLDPFVTVWEYLGKDRATTSRRFTATDSLFVFDRERHAFVLKRLYPFENADMYYISKAARARIVQERYMWDSEGPALRARPNKPQNKRKKADE